jgi:hypothetical protein
MLEDVIKRIVFVVNCLKFPLTFFVYNDFMKHDLRSSEHWSEDEVYFI